MTLLDQVIGQLIGAVNILGDDGIGFVGPIVDVHIHLREIDLCNLLPDTLIENTKKDQAVEQPSGLYRVHVRRKCCCCRRNHDTRAGCSLQLVDDPLVHCHIKFSFVSGAEPRTHDDTDFFALPFSVVRKDITGFSRKCKNFFFQFFSHAVFSVERLGNCYFTDAQLICQVLHGY